MSNSPADDERLDSDPTDELPILLETAVLDPEEHGIALADDSTGEHTARYPALTAHDAANVDALKSDLEQRRAKIVALEQDISHLSARWLDIERHLTAKDTLIDELKTALASVRSALDSRGATERRLTAEIADRDSQLARLTRQVAQLEREAAARNIELADRKRDHQAALEDLARVKDELFEHAAASREPSDLQPLHEEVAALTSYIANRRAWWDELEARAAAQTARIAELEREVAHRTERQQRADSLAERAVARAHALREDLLAQGRRSAALEAELSEQRAEPLRVRAALATLEARLAEMQAAAAEAERLRTETEARLADASRALAEQRAAQLRRDDEHTAALAAADERRTTELAAAAAAAAALPRVPVEAIARLEADVSQANSELAAERAKVQEQSERLAAADASLDSTLRQLTETRAQLEQARSDAARIERAVVDKDRALEARDERIAAMQRELDQKLGALQKLNAMDLSLQGLDLKMSERLKRNDAPADHPNTPALVCLSSDAPRQYALLKKTMTIGRSATCDIQILTHFVSREHARLIVARGSVLIEDLGSTNGVFVNAARIDRHELRHGDLVTIGETQFRFLESMAH